MLHKHQIYSTISSLRASLLYCGEGGVLSPFRVKFPSVLLEQLRPWCYEDGLTTRTRNTKSSRFIRPFTSPLPSLANLAGPNLTGPISTLKFPHLHSPSPSIFTVLHDHISIITDMYPQNVIHVRPLVAHFTNKKYYYTLDFMLHDGYHSKGLKYICFQLFAS